jgi:hypothetical protein
VTVLGYSPIFASVGMGSTVQQMRDLPYTPLKVVSSDQVCTIRSG